MNQTHLSNVTPMDGGEMVADFCVAIDPVMIEVVMTADVIKLRVFVELFIGGGFMILGLASEAFGSTVGLIG